MIKDFDAPYGTNAPIYQALGYWSRPVFNGIDPHTGKLAGKACKIKNWQLPDHEWPSGEIDRWARDYPTYNIGLLMGSRFPDGSYFGAFDNDDDRYVRLSRTLLRNPICSRIGKKGIAHFVR